MNGVSHFFGTWFGYVGSCVIGPDATCRPFLAFLALGVAAAVGLTLLLLWYRSAQREEIAAVEEKRTRARVLDLQQRVRRRSVVQPTRVQPLRPGPAGRGMPLPV